MIRKANGLIILENGFMVFNLRIKKTEYLKKTNFMGIKIPELNFN